MHRNTQTQKNCTRYIINKPVWEPVCICKYILILKFFCRYQSETQVNTSATSTTSMASSNTLCTPPWWWSPRPVSASARPYSPYDLDSRQQWSALLKETTSSTSLGHDTKMYLLGEWELSSSGKTEQNFSLVSPTVLSSKRQTILHG